MHAALKAGHIDSSKCVDKHDLRVLYQQLLTSNVEHFGSFEAPEGGGGGAAAAASTGSPAKAKGAAPKAPRVGGGNMRISVRRAGYLMKKKFSSGGKGKWQRRWFVLKDAFLLYYKVEAGYKPGAAYTWNNKPLGCIPLGNTAIQRVKGRNADGTESCRAWEIVHKDFHGGALLLAADEEQDAAAWITLLEQNRTVTYENCMLGEAEVRRLEEETSDTKGTIAQKEADRLIALAEKEAAAHAASLAELEQRKAEFGEESEAAKKAQAELDALEATMAAAKAELEANRERSKSKAAALAKTKAKHEDEDAALNAKVEEMRVHHDELLAAAEADRRHVEEERAAHNRAKKKQARVERRLKRALGAIEKLEGALLAHSSTAEAAPDVEISQSVMSLKHFFKARIDDETRKVHAEENVAKGLSAVRTYKHAMTPKNSSVSSTTDTADAASTAAPRSSPRKKSASVFVVQHCGKTHVTPTKAHKACVNETNAIPHSDSEDDDLD